MAVDALTEEVEADEFLFVEVLDAMNAQIATEAAMAEPCQ